MARCPFSREAWRLVVDRARVLGALLDRYEGLLVGADPDRFVVTHGEPHRGNIVVTDTGVVLVDWDTCLLGPGPHGDDDDTRTAWAALRGVLASAPDTS